MGRKTIECVNRENKGNVSPCLVIASVDTESDRVWRHDKDGDARVYINTALSNPTGFKNSSSLFPPSLFFSFSAGR